MPELSELGSLEIVNRLKEKELSGKDLPINVRQEIVNILRHEHTQAEMAFILSVNDSTIVRDVKVLKKAAAKNFGLDITELAADLQRTASFLKGKAIKAKDYKLAWQIERELIEAMQNLGYVYREPTEIKTEVEAGPELIKLLGQGDGNGRTFAEHWRDTYRHAGAN